MTAARKARCNDVAMPAPPLRPADATQDSGGSSRGSRQLLVVSHPAVVSVNQEVYRELARRGWELTIVLPRYWRHAYAEGRVTPTALEGLESSLRPTPVLFAGKPQRHIYLTRCSALCRRLRPDVAFLEAEPFALAAAQWGRALAGLGIPFGVQSYENIDRGFPRPVRALRSRVLAQASFVAARSDTAGELARRWGARGEIGLALPAVPLWGAVPEQPAERPFTVGYAGRLVQEKGLTDLLDAVRELGAPVELLLIGDGEMRSRLQGQPIPGSSVRVLHGLRHDEMAGAYAQLDVLVLPSHTTETWKEQLGRVIVEALSCGVPVIGSDSGEIPWLVGLTGGGLCFPEGDAHALAQQLQRLREDPALRERLARDGGAAVQRLFTVPAATDALERLLIGALERG